MGRCSRKKCCTTRYVCVKGPSWYLSSHIALVMIVSYETLRTLTAYIANCEIGLLLCDEGHRLKNSGIVLIDYPAFNAYLSLSESLTFQALHGLKVSRRVILTGTPIQVWRLCIP